MLIITELLMAESQAHGNKFEDVVTLQRTKLSKTEYDKLKKSGYTSPFDLVDGLIVDYNGSIKTTGSNTICCSDILRMMNHTGEYRMVVGCYDQINKKQKHFHTQYEFFVKPEDYSILWGNNNVEITESYVNKVKSVNYKDRSEVLEYRTPKKRDTWLKELNWDFNGLMRPNPKVDSSQTRVQCSMHLDRLLESGIEYTKTDIDMTIESKPRKRNKK